MSPIEPGDRLDAGAIEAAMANERVGRRVIVLEEATSTNDVVLQMARENSEGLVVFAETQTAARGQYGRRWESAAGQGLWLSILLRPKIALNESAELTDLLARTIAATAEAQTGVVCTIKPPNDVYAAGRKIAGVLVEMRVETGGGYAAIAGLGINLNQTAENFPAELRTKAASLSMVAGRRIDRERFAIALLRELAARYRY